MTQSQGWKYKYYCSVVIFKKTKILTAVGSIRWERVWSTNEASWRPYLSPMTASNVHFYILIDTIFGEDFYSVFKRNERDSVCALVLKLNNVKCFTKQRIPKKKKKKSTKRQKKWVRNRTADKMKTTFACRTNFTVLSNE